jgi:hypothetical protein
VFDIRFFVGPHVDVGERLGTITIGKDVETFISPIGFWQTDDYELQWRQAAQRLMDGADRSGFFISVADPAQVELYRWWPVWREGDAVFIHEQLVLLRQLGEPFNLRNPYRHVGERQQISEDGHRISEWRVAIQDIAAFLERHPTFRVPT